MLWVPIPETAATDTLKWAVGKCTDIGVGVGDKATGDDEYVSGGGEDGKDGKSGEDRVGAVGADSGVGIGRDSNAGQHVSGGNLGEEACGVADCAEGCDV